MLILVHNCLYIVLVQVTFLMKYDYVNLTTSLHGENKQPEPIWLQQVVYVQLGKIN